MSVLRLGGYYNTVKELSDADLLRAYADERCESAFAELTHRYVSLVHSAASRMVRDPHLAQDVTQRVFVALARTAGRLRNRRVIAAWLHTTTRNIAAEVVRTEARRRVREEDAAAMHSTNDQENGQWERIAAELDGTLDRLSEPDRNLLLLRFFKNHDLRTIGVALGISEDAAQKRVSRALDRLRSLFQQRGITTSAGSLAALLVGRAVEAAPPVVVAAVSAAPAIANTLNLGIGTVTHIFMTTAQKTIILGTSLLVGAGAVYEVHRTSQSREQVAALERRITLLGDQLEGVTAERDEALHDMTELRRRSQIAADTTLDLARLRGEVAALRQAERERGAAGPSAAGWEARIQRLKLCLDSMPERRIPEMSWLSDDDWAAASRNADLESDEGVRLALSDLRRAAKSSFLDAAKKAIKAYVTAACGHSLPDDTKEFARIVNDNPTHFPSHLDQLKPYFDTPVDADVLARYQFQRPEKLNEWLTDILVKEVAPPVDEEYDTRLEIGLNAGSVGPVNLVADAVVKAAKSFAQAHGGNVPATPAELAPFLERPLPPETVHKYFTKLVSGDRLNAPPRFGNFVTPGSP